MQLKKFFELHVRHLIASKLMDLNMAEINHILVQCIHQHLVVCVLGTLRQCKVRVLADEVLEPEIAIVMDACIVEGIFVREQ